MSLLNLRWNSYTSSMIRKGCSDGSILIHSPCAQGLHWEGVGPWYPLSRGWELGMRQTFAPAMAGCWRQDRQNSRAQLALFPMRVCVSPLPVPQSREYWPKWHHVDPLQAEGWAVCLLGLHSPALAHASCACPPCPILYTQPPPLVLSWGRTLQGPWGLWSLVWGRGCRPEC